MREVLDDVEDLAHELRVERGGRLVEQEDLGLGGERPGDGDALLLTAGQLARPGVGLVGQTDALEQDACLGLDLVARTALRVDRRLDQVLQHRQVREQVEALEHEADAGALAQHVLLAQLPQRVAAALVADDLAADRHEPPVHPLEVVDDAQQGRLARAGRADDDRHLSGLHDEVDAGEHLERAVGLVHTVHLDQARAHRSPPVRNRWPAPRVERTA